MTALACTRANTLWALLRDKPDLHLRPIGRASGLTQTLGHPQPRSVLLMEIDRSFRLAGEHADICPWAVTRNHY